MGKIGFAEQKPENKSHKTHKTLRDKLRKKREQLKRHKKEKSDHKKQYNAEEQKLKFFIKGAEKEDSGKELKLKKIHKYIEKFINIYEDDLEEFYDLFKTLDEGGFIDITGLENKQLYKCLKKLFKYLPVCKEKKEYKKIQSSTTCLQKFIKNKVSESIQNYLQNGSNMAESNDQSSLDQKQDKKQAKKQRKSKLNKQEEDMQQKQIRLYKETIQQPANTMGPYIPQQVRQQMAQMFEQQLLQMQKNKQEKDKAEEDEFAKIFSSGKTRKEMKEYSGTKSAFDVPEHLLALGSAQIGQKVEIDDGQIEEYNKMHRPKKLIDMHKQLKSGMIAQDPSKRKPFDRQRDIVGSGKLSLMNNSTFFDFKSRMSKPKNTNQFL